MAGSVTVFLGVLIAFINQTSTTPISSPILAQGTTVKVTDNTGAIVSATTLS